MKCCRCLQIKDITEFYANKGYKNGHSTHCKECKDRPYKELLPALKSNPTPELAAKHTLRNISTRLLPSHKKYSPCYKDIENQMTLGLMKEFFESNWETFMELFQVWKDNEFSRKFYPSIDRIDNNRHYSPDNIQLLPMHENSRKSNYERRKSSLI